MVWAALIPAAAGVASAALGSLSGSRAARQQQQAAQAALDEQRRQYDTSREDQRPYREAGAAALGRLSEMQDFDPTPHALAVQSEPGYQFGLQQGTSTVENSAAARGGLYSGNALKALTQYGNDYATTKYGQAFDRAQTGFGNRWNRLSNLAGVGQTSVAQSQQAGQAYGNAASGLLTGAGNAQAANSLAQGSIWGNTLNQVAAQNWGRQPSMQQQGVNRDRAAGVGDDGVWELADGGAVRPAPRSYGRTPLPQGGSGGGMSLAAIRAALDAAQAAAQPQKHGVGALPANPLTDPGAITRERMQRAERNYATGGAVEGADPGRADTVHARLSGGEHVFDAEIVSMLGDGNTEAGHALLEELKQRVRAHKRAAPPALPAE